MTLPSSMTALQPSGILMLSPDLIFMSHTLKFISLIDYSLIFTDLRIALLLYIRIVVYTYAKIYIFLVTTKYF